MKSEVEKAIRWAGGKTWLAVKAGVGERAVGTWSLEGRMPKTPALLLQCLSKGKLKADRLVKP